MLRRVTSARPDVTAYGDLVVDRAALRVLRDGVDLRLTPTELRLLLELTRMPGKALTRRQLLAEVWEITHAGDSRLVDACVQRVRAKISAEYIETVRGFGYRFVAP